LLAISICIFVSAGSDFSKARLFRALSAVVEDRKILAYRYNSEQPIEISVYDVMVGDVLYLRVGDKVPADCFYLSGLCCYCCPEVCSET
jgi:Ca2+-transporting ATPase